MNDVETEDYDDGAIRVRRFFRRGRHPTMICQDCRKEQYADIVHIVVGRRHVHRHHGCERDGQIGFIEFADAWLCEKCRSHRGRRDWVAPVSEGSPELTAARQQREAAVSASPANKEVDRDE